MLGSPNSVTFPNFSLLIGFENSNMGDSRTSFLEGGLLGSMGVARISFRRGPNFPGAKVNPSKNEKVTGFDQLFLKGPI